MTFNVFYIVVYRYSLDFLFIISLRCYIIYIVFHTYFCIQLHEIKETTYSGLPIYYSPEVRRGKYWGLGAFLLQYFPIVKIWKILYYNCINMNIVG